MAPSYDFDHFSDKSRRAEVERLQRQATVLVDRELAELQKLGLERGKAVAEIGCGPGFLIGAIAEASHAASALGLDSSRELLDVARTVVAPKHANLTFQEGSAYDTKLAAGRFDFVYNRLIYQHLDKPLDALREARRITKPGGKVCIADVDDSWLTLEPRCDAFERFTALAERAQAGNGGDRKIGRKLPGLFERAGFRDVRLNVVAVSTIDLGAALFLDITTNFKAIQIGSEEGQVLVEEIRKFAKAHERELLGVVGVFFAVGTA